jgi:cell division protein FtsQ
VRAVTISPVPGSTLSITPEFGPGSAQPPRGRAKRPSSRLRIIAPLTVAGLIGALSFAALTGFGGSVRKPGPLMGEVDRLAEIAGFGLDQVHVSGQRFTADTAILDALDLTNVRSLLHFDAAAARERIEKLPWIASATITRLLPSGLSIAVTERKPFAVWQHADRETLIDAGGRQLAGVRAGAAPELPHVAGAGAPEASAALFAALGPYPELLGRMTVAKRIGNRRWTLQLSGDLEVLLPPSDEAGAVEVLMRTINGRRLIDAGAGRLDLRRPGRVVAEPAFPSSPGLPQPPSRPKQNT